jgi:serine O-acetyltransferase
MNRERLQLLKLRLGRLWVVSPERLWLGSIALHRRGHWVAAFLLKQLNTLLYHNSLSPGASVEPDIRLGHNSIGIVVSGDVEIGRRVKLWHNVTLSAGRPLRRPDEVTDAHRAAEGNGDGGASWGRGPRSRILLEDGVKIGANAVVIPGRGQTIRVGRGARIGAGAVVTEDVPAGATVVGASPRVISSEPSAGEGERIPGEDP